LVLISTKDSINSVSNESEIEKSKPVDNKLKTHPINLDNNRDSYKKVGNRKDSMYDQSSNTNNISNIITNDNNNNWSNVKTERGSTGGQTKQMNKQEKAFKQLLAIVIGFTLCFTPYFIVFLLNPMCNCVSDNVFNITLWLGYFNSTLNPFLYAMNSRQKCFTNDKKKKNRPVQTFKNKMTVSISSRKNPTLNSNSRSIPKKV
jgi:hypothetical protein